MSESEVLRGYSGTNEIHVLEKDVNYAIKKLIIYFIFLLLALITEWIRNDKLTGGWEVVFYNLALEMEKMQHALNNPTQGSLM